MALHQDLRLNQSGSLVMTPQLQQAIKILQMSHQDLESFITEQTAENPLLHVEDRSPYGDIGSSGNKNTLSNGERQTVWDEWSEIPIPNIPTSLQEHVLTQINTDIHDPVMRLIGANLVHFLQPTGYFDGNIEHIAGQLGAPISLVKNTLSFLQQFDPPGVFARNIQECLRLQLEDEGVLTPPFEALLANLHLLGQYNLSSLQKKCAVTEDVLLKMIKKIRSLSPKPGLCFEQNNTLTVVPEILMTYVQDKDGTKEWVIDLNTAVCPKVLVNLSYYTYIKRNIHEQDEKRYLAERLTHANWLVKALHQRAITLIKVSSEIVRQQEDFFKNGIAYLKPLVLKDVAQAVQLHESTVSRVTNNKYISTPRGIFELKYFFNTCLEGASGVCHASTSVRHRIQSLIGKEDPNTPLSDDRIALLLHHEGIMVARRTVAKYREMLRIPPAFQRRRWLAACRAVAR